jgi:hypothetical protein
VARSPPELPQDAYRATLTLARALPVFTAERRDHLVWVHVTNEGTARWPGGENQQPLVRVGIVREPGDRGPRHDVGRAMLPHALDPAEIALVPLEVYAPLPGPAELVLDLVHEHARWFGCPLRLQLEVEPSAAQRLNALTTRHGASVPLAAVMRERRAIGGNNGLLRPSMPDAHPADSMTACRLGGGRWTPRLSTGSSRLCVASFLARSCSSVAGRAPSCWRRS